MPRGRPRLSLEMLELRGTLQHNRGRHRDLVAAQSAEREPTVTPRTPSADEAAALAAHEARIAELLERSSRRAQRKARRARKARKDSGAHRP